MAINLNFGAWVRVARTFSGSHGLTLKWATEHDIEQMGAQAWTDGRRIFTRRPSPLWSEEQLTLWTYYLFHEVGHTRPGRRDMFKVLEKYKPSGLLAYVNNLLEDHVQECVMQDEEPSLRNHVAKGRAAYYEFILKSAVSADKARKNPQAPCLFSWDAMLRVPFQRPTAGYAEQFLRPVQDMPEVQGWMDKLLHGDYATVLKDKPDVWQVYDLAKRIVREVFDQDPDEQESGSDGAPGDGQGEAGGDGQGQGKGQGENGQQGASQGAEQGNGEGQSEGNGEGPAGNTDGTEDYAEWLAGHDHAKDKRSGSDEKTKGGGGELTIDYSSYFDDGATGSNVFIPNLEGMEVYTIDRVPHDNTYSNPEPPTSTLSKRIARHMQAQTRNRKVYGQKSGTLSGRSLYRLKMKDVGGVRERVFHRRILNKSKDVAVTVLVDLSGSMGSFGGPKARAAVAAVAHLHDVISKQLNIPLEVLGYSETTMANSANDVGIGVIFQQFGKAVPNDRIIEGMRKAMAFNGCNRDGETLLWARERLLARKSSRHIMIVISDGQPKARSGRDVAGFTKDVVKQIEREGMIDLYAIGLRTDSVRYFYSQYKVINEPDELEGALLTVLKDKILDEVTA